MSVVTTLLLTVMFQVSSFFSHPYSPMPLARIQTARSIAHSSRCQYNVYIFDIHCNVFITKYVCVLYFYYHSACWSSVSIRSQAWKDDFLNVSPIDYTAFAISGKVWVP